MRATARLHMTADIVQMRRHRMEASPWPLTKGIHSLDEHRCLANRRGHFLSILNRPSVSACSATVIFSASLS